MRPNKLRALLDADQPSIGTHIHSSWPSIAEIVGHTGMFDYVEFVAQYAPFDLNSMDNFCRATELQGLSSMIKIDQEPRRFLAERAIGAGFQSVLFADCRTVEDFEECVRAVRPETPEDGGVHGRRDTAGKLHGRYRYPRVRRVPAQRCRRHDDREEGGPSRTWRRPFR